MIVYCISTRISSLPLHPGIGHDIFDEMSWVCTVPGSSFAPSYWRDCENKLTGKNIENNEKGANKKI